MMFDFHLLAGGDLFSALVDHVDCGGELLDLPYLGQGAKDWLVGVVVDGIFPELSPDTIVDLSLLRIAEPSESLLGLDEDLCSIFGGVHVRMCLTDHPLVGSSDFIL